MITPPQGPIAGAPSPSPPPPPEVIPPGGEEPVRRVCAEDGALWIHKALEDFRAAPRLSLGLGLVHAAVALVLAAILDAMGQASLLVPLAAGFMLVAPLSAVLFSAISRRREAGERPTLAALWPALRPRLGPLVGMAGILGGLLVLWIGAALGVFAAFFGTPPPSLEALIVQLLTAPQAGAFLVSGTLVGGLCAVITFAIGAVTLPLLLDRPIGIGAAMAISLRAVRRNPRVMAGWAIALAVMTLSGMVFAFVGLAVTLPLAGYASWHAYRSLVP